LISFIREGGEKEGREDEERKKRKDAGRQPKEGVSVIRSTQITNVTININRVGYNTNK